MTRTDVAQSIDAVWRIESARLIAGLTRMVNDVGLAEELAQDALVAALEQWPSEGTPKNPGAWLMAVSKRRAVDRIRRDQNRDVKYAEVGRTLQETTEFDAALEDTIEDDLLRLMFVSCHPVLGTEARVALTLKLLGGLKTGEIARAFLVSESTVAQRIVRAKRALADAEVPFEVPGRDELPDRLASVLEVIYLVFNEGYSATAGDDWMRPEMCAEALRLGRLLAGLMPDEPEVHGLVALMEIQASRLQARTKPDGTPILLLDQDRVRWDRMQIDRGLKALARAERLRPERGPYTQQAALAACHARARTAADTDWQRIAELYAQLEPTPIVELNRAVAVSMAHGPAAGLDIVDGLKDVAALKNYHLLPSVRGDLLAKLGRTAEARAEFERAAQMTQNEQERKLLAQRAENL